MKIENRRKMPKSKPVFTLFLSLGFCLATLLINLIFPLSSFSQSNNTTEEETLTITTYYPAPYGVYNEMRANKMVIGDTNASSTPSPATPGVVRFKGLATDPGWGNDSQEGALYYNTQENNFKYYNGTVWQKLGGGLPPGYQWVPIGNAAIALKDGAEVEASCTG